MQLLFFQLFLSVAVSSLRYSPGFTHMSAQKSFFSDRLSLYITASPLVPSFFFTLLYFTWHLLYHIICHSLSVPNPTLKVSSMRTETLSLLFTARPHIRKSAWTRENTKCALTAWMRNSLKFCKNFSIILLLYSCSVQYISYNQPKKHFSFLRLTFSSVFSHLRFIELLLSTRSWAQCWGFCGKWRRPCLKIFVSAFRMTVPSPF